MSAATNANAHAEQIGRKIPKDRDRLEEDLELQSEETVAYGEIQHYLNYLKRKQVSISQFSKPSSQEFTYSDKRADTKVRKRCLPD